MTTLIDGAGELIKQAISNGSAVTIGAAASIMLTVCGVAWYQASWQTGIQKDVDSLVEDLGDLKKDIHEKLGEMRATINFKSRDRWQRSDMAGWARELAAKNGELDVPAPVTITE